MCGGAESAQSLNRFYTHKIKSESLNRFYTHKKKTCSCSKMQYISQLLLYKLQKHFMSAGKFFLYKIVHEGHQHSLILCLLQKQIFLKPNKKYKAFVRSVLARKSKPAPEAEVLCEWCVNGA